MRENTIKVRLTMDRTRYVKGPVSGSEGITVGRQGIWNRGNDHFITVCFPGIAIPDVLWESPEIIGEDVLREQEEAERRVQETLMNACDVALYLGLRGGFQSLSYT